MKTAVFKFILIFALVGVGAVAGNKTKSDADDTLEMELESNITVVKLDRGLKFEAHSTFDTDTDHANSNSTNNSPSEAAANEEKKPNLKEVPVVSRAVRSASELLANSDSDMARRSKRAEEPSLDEAKLEEVEKTTTKKRVKTTTTRKWKKKTTTTPTRVVATQKSVPKKAQNEDGKMNIGPTTRATTPKGDQKATAPPNRRPIEMYDDDDQPVDKDGLQGPIA